MIINISLSALFVLFTLRLTSAQYLSSYNEPCKKTSRSSFLWRINGSPASYLFGTVHVPYTKVWPNVAPIVKTSFAQADQIFFELDLTDPVTLGQLSQCQLIDNNQQLSGVLTPNLFARISHQLDYVRKQLPYWLDNSQFDSTSGTAFLYANFVFKSLTKNWRRKRPIWILILINSLTRAELGQRGIPVLDLYLAQEARRLNKDAGAIEEVAEQCQPLNKIDINQVTLALDLTLKHLEQERDKSQPQENIPTEDLIRHYNCGDLSPILFRKDSGPIPEIIRNSTLTRRERNLIMKMDRYFRRELIYKRNVRMSQRIASLLKMTPDKSFFFALGAGHFIGESDTIIDLLISQGHNITLIKRNPSTNEIKHPRKDRDRKTKEGYSFPTFAMHQHLNMIKPGWNEPKQKEMPEFKPKYVHFENLWIRIENFTPAGAKVPFVDDTLPPPVWGKQSNDIRKKPRSQLSDVRMPATNPRGSSERFHPYFSLVIFLVSFFWILTE